MTLFLDVCVYISKYFHEKTHNHISICYMCKLIKNTKITKNLLSDFDSKLTNNQKYNNLI